LADPPSTIGKNISFTFRLLSAFANLVVIAIDSMLLRSLYLFFVVKLNWTVVQLLLLILFAIFATTAILYVYNVYIVHFGMKNSIDTEEKTMKGD
jgi:hypothetical protein